MRVWKGARLTELGGSSQDGRKLFIMVIVVDPLKDRVVGPDSTWPNETAYKWGVIRSPLTNLLILLQIIPGFDLSTWYIGSYMFEGIFFWGGGWLVFSKTSGTFFGGSHEVSDGCWMTLSRSVVNIAIRFGGFNVFFF